MGAMDQARTLRLEGVAGCGGCIQLLVERRDAHVGLKLADEGEGQSPQLNEDVHQLVKVPGVGGRGVDKTPRAQRVVHFALEHGNLHMEAVWGWKRERDASSGCRGCVEGVWKGKDREASSGCGRGWRGRGGGALEGKLLRHSQ